MHVAVRTAPGRLDEVRWIDLPSQRDSRGVLTAVESGQDVPFEVKRVYFLHHIVGERGGHAHRDTTQLVVAVAGQCEMLLCDGTNTRSFLLDDPTRGLLLVPMLFINIRGFSADARVMVLANTHYVASRSIRSWEDYLAAISP
jgi:hypothetical protein